jgi:hypothetical protein
MAILTDSRDQRTIRRVPELVGRALSRLERPRRCELQILARGRLVRKQAPILPGWLAGAGAAAFPQANLADASSAAGVKSRSMEYAEAEWVSCKWAVVRLVSAALKRSAGLTPLKNGGSVPDRSRLMNAAHLSAAEMSILAAVSWWNLPLYS